MDPEQKLSAIFLVPGDTAVIRPTERDKDEDEGDRVGGGGREEGGAGEPRGQVRAVEAC